MILTRPAVQTPEQLSIKQQIAELIEFERFCRDNAIWDEMSKCFTVDSRINISWFQGTGEEFVLATKKWWDARLTKYAAQAFGLTVTRQWPSW